MLRWQQTAADQDRRFQYAWFTFRRPLPQDHVIVVRFGITDGGVDSCDEVAFDIADKLTTS
jgi:hypothetical protein